MTTRDPPDLRGGQMPGPVTEAVPIWSICAGAASARLLSRTVRPALSGRSRPFRRYAGSGLICLLNVAGQAPKPGTATT